jgi:hypothetical protein
MNVAAFHPAFSERDGDDLAGVTLIAVAFDPAGDLWISALSMDVVILELGGDVTGADSAPTASVATLLHPSPNPFNRRTTLSFTVPDGGGRPGLSTSDARPWLWADLRLARRHGPGMDTRYRSPAQMELEAFRAAREDLSASNEQTVKAGGANGITLAPEAVGGTPRCPSAA